MTLPKEVQHAVGRVDRSLSEWGICQQPWQTIHAHLLSQDAEIERLQSRLAAIIIMRNKWEQDASDHLMTFGQYITSLNRLGVAVTKTIQSCEKEDTHGPT
jgi:hypothetical protein